MELTPEILLKAYACGAFPMADSATSPDVFWIDPEQRGILPLNGVHLPRRLAKRLKQQPFRVTIDTAFAQVMEHCAEMTDLRSETWINSTITDLYNRLHAMQHAHSVECWDGDVLVGGLYGVRLGGAFFGESMFHRAADASKIALMYLIARLRVGGFTLLDTQFTTKHLEQFGTVEIARDAYQQKLASALSVDADFYRLAASSTPLEILQSVTHRS